MKIANPLPMRKCTSMLAVVFNIIFPCCFLFGLVWTLIDGQKKSETPSGQDGQDSSVCTGDLLDQRHYHYEKETDGSYRFTSDQSGSCRLVQYTTDRVVSCIDSLHYAKQLASNGSSNSPLFFIFLGDSRVRQQYINFVRLIPDYDHEMHPMRDMYKFHGEVEIRSNILRLRMAFKWRPFVDDNVTEAVHRWVTSDPTERPHVVFLGMALHHMKPINGTNHQIYQKKLKELAPELGRLANVTHVIWLNQYSIDETFKTGAGQLRYHTEKLHNYNKAARRVFRNENKHIRIWDSKDPLVDEYIRSCFVLKRNEVLHPAKRPYLFQETFYENCRDSIHTGSSALLLATNLFYNDICNNAMNFF
ncbi:uncharacterized protein LOC130690408 [Daphnia carinata]|uniref:uncharacterized protein LOC130690408 n=1 Tax=Daphnia carinata TaxID=120202 RepID=UPI00257EFABC|nr:uncharacterized protein LOC130690408 [Daphnia carinata]